MLYTDLMSSQPLRTGLDLRIQAHTFGYNKKQLEHSKQPVIAHNIRTSLSRSLSFFLYHRLSIKLVAKNKKVSIKYRYLINFRYVQY